MSAAPRARRDAERNRERLIAAAREAFTADATTPLDAVATSAGVGIGTLYRHFSSREALVEAVYRRELTAVCDRAAPLLRRYPPAEALRRWMGHYADFVATKRGMAEALRDVIAAGTVNRSDTRAHLEQAVGLLLAAAVEAGTVRPDARADDVVAALAGALMATTSPTQTNRLLDLLLDSLRAFSEIGPVGGGDTVPAAGRHAGPDPAARTASAG